MLMFYDKYDKKTKNKRFKKYNLFLNKKINIKCLIKKRF